MAAKKPNAKGPGKPGPATAPAHQAVDPEVQGNIAEASKGDRYALAMLYGHAGAWLRAGKAPPAELAAWLVCVLEDLHAVAWCAREKDPPELSKQLAAATRFGRRRGRPTSRKSALKEEELASEVYQFLTWGWATSLEDAFAKVSEYHQRMKLPPAQPDQVRDAWRRFGKKFGEFHHLTG